MSLNRKDLIIVAGWQRWHEAVIQMKEDKAWRDQGVSALSAEALSAMMPEVEVMATSDGGQMAVCLA